jgi:hypothetical protein
LGDARVSEQPAKPSTGVSCVPSRTREVGTR